MKQHTKRCAAITAGLFLLFLLFTVAVKTIDVQAIGPNGSEVGFAVLNQWVFDTFGQNRLWYHITDWLGVAAIFTAFGFAILGAVQLIRRKSLKKVDASLLLLGGFYLLVIGAYVLFETVVVNYRPVILGTGLEASYPSSHTMIVLCLMTTAVMMFRRLWPEKKALRITASTAAILIAAVTVIGRLISGVHWFTDILGGILLSATLCMLYYTALSIPKKE